MKNNMLENVFTELKDRELTNEQIDLIFEPLEAQENYYQDGELNELQARRHWIGKLQEEKLNYKSIIDTILE